MLSFDLELFTDCWASIAHLRQADDGVAVDPSSASDLADKLEMLEPTLIEMGLRMTAKSAVESSSALRGRPGRPWRVLLTDFIIRFRDESDLIKMFSLEPENAKYYESDEPLFGSEVSSVFPSATYDISEAGSCLAVERWTACVFHLMRALEHGLHAMAESLGVPGDCSVEQWKVIIDRIEKRIKQIDDGKRFPDKQAILQRYSEAAADFRYFKNAWRNHVSHVKEKYGKRDATRIFEHVRSFMQSVVDLPEIGDA